MRMTFSLPLPYLSLYVYVSFVRTINIKQTHITLFLIFTLPAAIHYGRTIFMTPAQIAAGAASDPTTITIISSITLFLLFLQVQCSLEYHTAMLCVCTLKILLPCYVFCTCFVYIFYIVYYV